MEQRAHQHGTVSKVPRRVCQSCFVHFALWECWSIGKNVMTLKLTSTFISFYYFIHASVHTHTTEFWRLILKRATALICTEGRSAKSDCLHIWENILVSPNTRTTSSFNTAFIDWQLANPTINITTLARMRHPRGRQAWTLLDGSLQSSSNKVKLWYPFTMSILLEEVLLSRCFNCGIFFWVFSTRKF